MRAASELWELTFDLSTSDATDEDAAAQLRTALSTQPDAAAARLLEMLGKGRETPTSDRAYRLATAAVLGAAAESVEPSRLELFRRLKEMETIPIADAYARLAALVPALDALAETVEPLVEDAEDVRWDLRQHKSLDRLIGPNAADQDALIRTARMQRLALDYLRIAAGDTSRGTGETPHREIRRGDLKRLEESDRHEVEHLPGGRIRITAHLVPREHEPDC
jgi:hypothetical protein